MSAEQTNFIRPGLLLGRMYIQGVYSPAHPRVEGGEGARQGAKKDGPKEISGGSSVQVGGSEGQ